MMRKLVVAILLAILAFGAYVIWGFLEADRWIDRCADNSHPAYIQDELARREACKIEK